MSSHRDPGREAMALRSTGRLRDYVSERFGCTTTMTAPEDLRKVPSSHTTHAGPMIWIQNQLIKRGEYHKAGCPEIDVITQVRVVGGKSFAEINIARSAMFNTPAIVRPLNLTSRIVTMDTEAGIVAQKRGAH